MATTKKAVKKPAVEEADVEDAPEPDMAWNPPGLAEALKGPDAADLNPAFY